MASRLSFDILCTYFCSFVITFGYNLAFSVCRSCFQGLSVVAAYHRNKSFNVTFCKRVRADYFIYGIPYYCNLGLGVIKSTHVELLFPLVCCPSSCSYSCTFALVTEELACCHCLSYYSLILAIRFGLNLGAGIGVGSSVAIIIAGPTTETVILSLTR